jgi:hypothetical protein
LPVTDGQLCPHCGNLVRPDARFCNSCGKPLNWNAAETSPDLTVPTVTQEATPVDALPGLHTGAEPEFAPAPAAETKQEVSPKNPLRRALLWLILVLAIGGCGLALVAGYFAARQLGWLARQTPLAVLSTTPVQEVVSATPTRSPSTNTPMIATATNQALAAQATATSTVEPTPTATLQIAQTEPPAETLAAPLPAAGLLFEDTFDAGLRDHWLTWGEPRATISAGFGDNWLNLKALDPPGQAGVTTRPDQVIPNEEGVVIEFDAEMDEKYPQAVLILDWDPASFDRGPQNQEPGFLRLEIWADKLKLYGRAVEQACEQPVTGTDGHTYVLQLTGTQGAVLYLDGADQPICQIASMNIEAQPGKISFSGLGWVSRVKVLLPGL